jgi:hypothetical protein
LQERLVHFAERKGIQDHFIAEDHGAFNPKLTRYDYDLKKVKGMFHQAGIGPETGLTWWTIAGS